MVVTIGMFPGIMLGMEWYDEEETDYKALIIDLLFVRVVIEV